MSEDGMTMKIGGGPCRRRRCRMRCSFDMKAEVTPSGDITCNSNTALEVSDPATPPALLDAMRDSGRREGNCAAVR
jgi:hypothetical protein